MSSFRFEVWPTEFRSITQPFGVNADFYRPFGLPGHEGIDFMAPNGSKIFAVAPGRVVQVHHNPDSRVHAYGIHVTVRHSEGYETIYAHLQEIHVNVGNAVFAGQVLGLGDNTGNSTGPHLHLTLRKLGGGQPGWPNNIIDPTPFVLPLIGWREPAGPFTNGWAFTTAITIHDRLAQANAGGISLRSNPSRNAHRLAIVPEGTMMIVTGSPRGEYTPVQVPSVAIGLTPPRPEPAPEPEMPPTVSTINGWGWTPYLTIHGNRAVVGELGINLRAGPDRSAVNIGLVRGGSAVTVRGENQGEYTPVEVSQGDFLGPINWPEAAPPLPDDPDMEQLPDGVFLGWGHTPNMTITGEQAVVGQFGIMLRSRPSQTSPEIGVVKAFATTTVAGLPKGNYTPILARREDLVNIVSPLPQVEKPERPANTPPRLPIAPAPVHDTTPGWAFTGGVIPFGDEGVVGVAGINLRDEPRRDAANLGFVPPDAPLIITGSPQGEYTPVRVDDEILQPPPAPETEATDPAPVEDPDPKPLGQARIGLHASADPGDLREAEFREFAALRPGIIKVLSAHSGTSIRRLAREHPNASWIVRAFLHFGGRRIAPDQFLTDTLSDVRRALDELKGKDVVIELHNEPNLTAEGLGASWSDGGQFAAWYMTLLEKYRQALPGRRFIYPGLSPGGAVAGIKQEHIAFIEAGRRAVEASDGLGVHIYWDRETSAHPMSRGLAVLDDYANRFSAMPIWVTEASNNKGDTAPRQKAQEYLRFWNELQQRPTVQGVTYFVASASDPQFAAEVWVGRGIGQIVGQR